MIADFATTAELLTYLRTDATGVDAVTSALAITAASDGIRQTCNRTFEVQGAAEDRYYTMKYPYSSQAGWPFTYAQSMAFGYYYPYPGYGSYVPWPPTMLEVDDFFLTGQTIGQITVTDQINGTTYAASQGWPFNAASQGMPYTSLVFGQGVTLPTGEGQLKVNAKYGYVTAAPTTIKNACLLQAARYVKRRDSPLGVAGIAEMGGVLRVLAKLDPDVSVMLNAYIKRWGAV